MYGPRLQRMSATKAGKISCNHVSGLTVGTNAPGPRRISHAPASSRKRSRRPGSTSGSQRASPTCTAIVFTLPAQPLAARPPEKDGCRLRGLVLVVDLLCEQGPRRSQVLVRQGHRGDVRTPTLLNLHDPSTARVFSFGCTSQRRPNTVDEQLAKIPVPSFADPEQHATSAGRTWRSTISTPACSATS